MPTASQPPNGGSSGSSSSGGDSSGGVAAGVVTTFLVVGVLVVVAIVVAVIAMRRRRKDKRSVERWERGKRETVNYTNSLYAGIYVCTIVPDNHSYGMHVCTILSGNHSWDHSYINGCMLYSPDPHQANITSHYDTSTSINTAPHPYEDVSHIQRGLQLHLFGFVYCIILTGFRSPT